MWPRLSVYTGVGGLSLPEPWCIEPMSQQIAPGTLLCLCVKGRSRDTGWCHLVHATAVQDGLVAVIGPHPLLLFPLFETWHCVLTRDCGGKWYSQLKASHFLHRGKCLHSLVSQHACVCVCVLCWQDSIAPDLLVSHSSLMGQNTFSSAWSLSPFSAYTQRKLDGAEMDRITVKRGSVLFSSLCRRWNGKVCDEKSACWGSVMKILQIPCPLPPWEGSEECSAWIEPKEEKGEGQRQAWGAQKGSVDNRHPV